MTAALCVLNLSNPTAPRRINVSIKRLSSEAALCIDDPTSIPMGTDPLVLYIAGHAIPNGLIDRSGERLDEATVAKHIVDECKGRKAVLIVWDVCFAKSFLELSGIKSWDDVYTHVFSCQVYERTWHSGEGSRDSYFARAFLQACQTCTTPSTTWGDLEKSLRSFFGNIQTPEISGGARSKPAEFELSTLS